MGYFILIVITTPSIYSDAIGLISFQEFNTKERCEVARSLVVTSSREYVRSANCVEK